MHIFGDQENELKSVSILFGLSDVEFWRYVGIGLIKIATLPSEDADKNVSAYEIQMGNKILSAAFQDGLLIRHDTRFARGKKALG
jgi:hypothetical protein